MSVDYIKKQLEKKPEDMSIKRFIREGYFAPTHISNYHFIDLVNDRFTSLADPKFFEMAEGWVNWAHANSNKVTSTRIFHGYHMMSRKFWEDIGGFTEEFYGRAFADDKMGALGEHQNVLHCYRSSPPWMTIAWTGDHKVEASYLDDHVPNWKQILLKKDPKAFSHPEGHSHYHLHRGFPDEKYASKIQELFNRTTPPVRFTAKK